MSITDIASSVFTNIFTTISNFILSFLYGITRPIWNLISNSLPQIDFYLYDLRNLLYYFMDICQYVIDFSLIKKTILLYIVGSIIFRISIKFTAFSIKTILKWWHYIAP